MVTSASCHEYTAITASTPTTTIVLTIQAMAPHWANRARVSMSEVTRETSTPFLASLWWPIDSSWTWPNARVRSPYRTFSAVRISR